MCCVRVSCPRSVLPQMFVPVIEAGTRIAGMSAATNQDTPPLTFLGILQDFMAAIILRA